MLCAPSENLPSQLRTHLTGAFVSSVSLSLTTLHALCSSGGWGPEPRSWALSLSLMPFTGALSFAKGGPSLPALCVQGHTCPEVALTHWDRIIQSVRAWTEHGGGGRSDARSPPLALAVTRQHVVFLGFGAHWTSTLGSPSPLLPFSGLWTQAGWQLRPSWASGSQIADGGASQPP